MIDIYSDDFIFNNEDVTEEGENYFKFADGSFIDMRYVQDSDRDKIVNITMFQLKTLLNNIGISSLDIDATIAALEEKVEEYCDERIGDREDDLEDKISELENEIEMLKEEIKELESMEE